MLCFVREICGVSAAHELPTDTEEAIMLWLHKVLDAVIFTHNREKVQIYICMYIHMFVRYDRISIGTR